MQKVTKLSIFGPIIVFAVWWLVTELNLVSPILLPRVGETLERLSSLLFSMKAFPDILATMYRTIFGFSMATLLGVSLGLIIGMYTKIYETFEIVIDFFRSLPATAMFPLFLLLFGIGSASKIAMAIFISFWVILLNTSLGVIHGSKTRRMVAKSLGASEWQIFRDVIIMETLPQTIIGLKIAISLSLISVIVSEMFIGSSNGLGQKIYDSYLTYETTNLYAWLLITGIVGYLLNRIFIIFERRTLHWAGK